MNFIFYTKFGYRTDNQLFSSKKKLNDTKQFDSIDTFTVYYELLKLQFNQF